MCESGGVFEFICVCWGCNGECVEYKWELFDGLVVMGWASESDDFCAVIV